MHKEEGDNVNGGLPEQSSAGSKAHKGKREACSPHDAYFNTVVGDLERAEAILQDALDDGIVVNTAWKTLKKVNGAGSTPQLRGLRTDGIYTAVYKGRIQLQLVLLAEHKSQLPRKDYPLELQLLGYLFMIYDLYFKGKLGDISTGSDVLPPLVIPVVLYHGEKKWKALRWKDLYDPAGTNDPILEYLPRIKYDVYDLSAKSDGHIIEVYQEVITAQIGLLSMKHIWQAELSESLEKIFQNADKLKNTQEVIDYLQSTIVYLGSVIKEPGAIYNVIRKQIQKSPVGQSAIMTGLELFFEQEFLPKHKAKFAAEKEQAIAAERAKAKEETATLMLQIMALLKKGDKTPEQIAQQFQLPLNTVLQYKAIFEA